METIQIAELIDRVMTGDPWHGASVRAIIDEIGPGEAARRPPGGAHSIWELVLHMAGWTREVTARLGGRPAQEPERGDWPEPGEPTLERWREAQTDLFAAHRELLSAVRRLDAATLSQPVVDLRDNSLGTGLSHYVTVHGAVHHTIYHAGQIALLRRALG